MVKRNDGNNSVIEITLFRHAKVAGPAALYGKTNVEAQKVEDQRIIDGFTSTEQEFDLVVSSPLQRCYCVAQQLSTKLKVKLTLNESFKEMNFGIIDGIPFQQIVGDKAFHIDAEKYWSLLETSVSNASSFS